MPIDNAACQDRVGMFYALKPLLKSKSRNRKFFKIVLTYTHFMYNFTSP